MVLKRQNVLTEGISDIEEFVQTIHPNATGPRIGEGESPYTPHEFIRTLM